MFEVPCNLYSGGHLVAADLIVWLQGRTSPSRGGRFHIPLNLEVLTGAKYRLEMLGERAKLLELPRLHSMDVRITEISGEVAHFDAVAPVG